MFLFCFFVLLVLPFVVAPTTIFSGGTPLSGWSGGTAYWADDGSYLRGSNIKNTANIYKTTTAASVMTLFDFNAVMQVDGDNGKAIGISFMSGTSSYQDANAYTIIIYAFTVNKIFLYKGETLLWNGGTIAYNNYYQIGVVRDSTGYLSIFKNGVFQGSVSDTAITGSQYMVATVHDGSGGIAGRVGSILLQKFTPSSLTSISESPSPVKGGNQITITPTGASDPASLAIYFYCNESGGATSGNTLCSQGNTSYASPYSDVTCTYNASGDGTKNNYCRTFNGTDYSTEKTTTFTVDSTAPTTSFSGCNNQWNNSNQTITLSCSDGSGVGCRNTRYRIDGGAWTNYSNAFTLSTDLNHQVDMNSDDTIDNQETPKTFYCAVDKTAPTSNSISVSSFSGIGKYTFANPTPLTTSSTDALSGIYQMKFSCNNSTYSAYEAYATSKNNFNVRTGEGCTDSDGNKTVYVIFKDTAGNESTVNTGTGANSFFVDTVVPTFTSIVQTNTGVGNYTFQNPNLLSLTASDSGSELYDMNFSCVGATFSSTEAFAATKSFNLRTGTSCTDVDGNKTVYARIRDRAYNVSTANTVNFYLDTVAPSSVTIAPTSYTGTGKYTFANPNPLTVSASDSGSELFDMNFSCDNATFDAPVAYATSNNVFNLKTGAGCANEDNNKTVYLRVRDRAYNVGTANSGTGASSFYLDTTAPTFSSISTTKTGVGNYTFQNPNLLSLTASDSGSELYDMNFSCVGATFSTTETFAATKSFNLRTGTSCTDTDGNKTVYARIRDRAYNVSTANTGTAGNSTYLDTANPIFTSIAVSSFSGLTGYTNVEKSPLSLTTSDSGSELYDMNFSCNGTTYSTPVSFSATYSDFNVASGAGCSNTDANKTVYSRIRDRAYNIGTANTSSFVLDRVSPKTNWDSNDFWKPFDVNVHLSIVDSTSGLQLIQFQKDSNKFSGIVFGSLTNYDSNILFVGDGNWALDFNSMDRAGNLSDTNRQFVLIDKIAPTINNVYPVNSSTVNLKTVFFDLNDAGFSGFNPSEVKVKINGVYSSSFVFAGACTAFDLNYHCSFNEAGIVNGSNTIIIDANDNAENHVQATTSFDYSLSLDVLVVTPNLPVYWGNFNADSDLNHFINVNFTDSVSNASPYLASFWLSSLAGAKQYLILKDVNLLSPVFCTIVDSNTQKTRSCRIGVSVSIVPDGNYVIDVNATDGVVQSIDSSDSFFQVDKSVPTLSNPNPSSNVTSDTETNPYLSLTGADNVGIKQCNIKVYKNGALYSDLNASPSGMVCGTNVSLPTTGDFGFISVVAYDFAMNPSALSSTANWTYQIGGGSGTPPPAGGGGGTEGGTGDINAFCVQSIQCLQGLVCVSNKCSVPSLLFSVDALLVSPTEITSSPFEDVLPKYKIVLQDIIVQNNSDLKIDLGSFFVCSSGENCAKDWCNVIGDANFTLQPKGVKIVKASCTIGDNALIGTTYFTQLVFNSVAGTKGVSIIIPVQYSSLRVFEPVRIVGKFFGDVWFAGLPCFGIQQNCLFSVGEKPPFDWLNKIPVWGWVMGIFFVLNIAAKFENKWLLGVFIALGIIQIVLLFI